MAQDVAWSDIFAVGHAGLDAEHRALIDNINAIGRFDAAREARSRLENLFAAQKALADGHYAHENAVMNRIIASVPELKAGLLHSVHLGRLEHHLQAHIAHGRELDAIVSRSLAHGAPLVDELQHWFFSHAVKADAHLKTVLQAIAEECPRLMEQLP